MAKISTYPQPTPPQLSDYVIGTDISDLLMTKNFVLSDMLNLFLPEITLQKVVNAGNTIVVPTTVSKGIDITLANESTVYQNGISVTIPTQTGVYPTYQPAPDAFVANINGQTPGTLIGSVVGFLANAAGEDNYSFVSEHSSSVTNSSHFVASNAIGVTSDFIRLNTSNINVFKVNHLGDITANSLSLFDSPNGEYSKIGINDSYFYVNSPGGNRAMISTEDGYNLILINGNGGAAQILNNLTTSRSYTLPNASGTFALTTDIPATPTLQQVTTAGAATTNSIAITSLGDDALTINAGANVGVYSTTNEGTALYGADSADGDGVYGESIYGNGVYGWSASGYGGYFYSDNDYSLVAAGTAAKPGGGSWSDFSDSRVKENIKPYSKGLAEIILVNPINYEYNGLANTTKGIEYTGVIAQEIKDIFPETVTIYKAKLNKEDEEDTELYNFNSTALTFALINAVKELKAEIELLKSK